MTADYEVSPRMVPANARSVLTVRPVSAEDDFTAMEEVEVSLIPIEGLVGEVEWCDIPRSAVVVENGVLRIAFDFAGEQEYLLLLERPERPPVEVRLFALEPDLFSRRPYKGDFHMHTHHSDGKESPGYVAAACRREGLDFMAITDHARYFPSLEAIRTFDGVDLDLRIYPGEEVHPPGNRVHILNFGGSFSVNELFYTDAYLPSVEALASSLADFPPGVDRYPYASCMWSFEQIRQGGGLAVFCHPYWLSRRRYDVPAYLTELLMALQPFDALELIGGYHRHEVESNLLQVARYHDDRAAGKRIPIVGVSDAHGCDTGSLFGWYYTLVFAPSSDLPDLVAAIKKLYSVAVEALPGEIARAHGPYRLARYAQFLLREYFPTHDALCRQEGEWMVGYVNGNEQAAAKLRACAGRVRALLDRWWGCLAAD
jgi:hypothetical protein